MKLTWQNHQDWTNVCVVVQNNANGCGASKTCINDGKVSGLLTHDCVSVSVASGCQDRLNAWMGMQHWPDVSQAIQDLPNAYVDIQNWPEVCLVMQHWPKVWLPVQDLPTVQHRLPPAIHHWPNVCLVMQHWPKTCWGIQDRPLPEI